MKYESNRPAIDTAIESGLRRGLDAAAIHLQGQIKITLSKHAGGSSPSGDPPGVKTGALRRSIQIDRSKNNGNNPKVRIGTNKVYAPIQEFGGTITAKGRGLAVPIHPDARRASDQGRGPRSFDNLIFIPREGRAPLLVREAGHGGIDVMYVLPKRVVLPARPFLRPTMQRERGKTLAIFKKGVALELAKMKGL